MQHQKAGNQVRKDQKRRLSYQEQQRIKANYGKTFKDVLKSVQLTEGQLKVFTSKLIK